MKQKDSLKNSFLGDELFARRSIRVAFISYPIAFQSQGGVAVQMFETMGALTRLGIEATLFDARYEKLADFDLIHVFGLIHGNHAIIEFAGSRGVPVVLSPILHPPFNRWRALTSDFCDRLTGRLTKWEVHTSYGQMKSALNSASRIVVLGRAEQEIVTQGYHVDIHKVSIVPNGISSNFFAADPKVFQEKYGNSEKLVLSVAYISPYKNQLGLVRALQNETCDIVLVGDCRPNDRPYLEECLQVGGQRLRYLGALDHDDPMLASAYAAADVMALVSQTECAPLAVLESLAAGTPSVVTKNHSLDLEVKEEVLVTVNPRDRVEIRDQVRALLHRPPAREACIAAVRGLTWDVVAETLAGIYSELLGTRSISRCKR